ncbi:MAG: YggT family protein [Patescibacteria group bacterium]
MAIATVKQETVTTEQVVPAATGEHPQVVYNKKKTIFRFNQIIWYILGLIEVLLMFRFILKALAANPNSSFVNLVYSLTRPLVSPFVGIFGITVAENSVLEWTTLIAALVYLCVAWGLVYLLGLFFPITPSDVEAHQEPSI